MSLLMKILMSPSGLSFDRALVRWTGESLLNRVFARQAGFAPQPALLLETRGRRSGTALMVVGSKGGMPTDPAWVSNLREHPDVTVYIARKRHDARARIATGEERAALWTALTARVPTYAHYQSLTTREIPVVILELAG